MNDESPHERDAVSDALIGVTIGSRYRVQTVLGRGGMGVVYAGVQEGLERPVALKVLRPAYADDADAIERMFREARSASQMGHPNICDVYDLGRLPDGRPYMVMPLLRGSDLSDLIEREAPLAPARVVELLRGPAAALDVMHASGIVHRDIKPENVFRVIHADGSEILKLVDFGLATMLFTDSRLTREGLICGTPHYIAPEAGDGTLPDARGDVYSLAVMAFEMLTKRLPFDGDLPMGIVTKKMVEPPPRLSDVSGREFPEALESVLRRGLATDPQNRFDEAGELVSALARAAGEAPAPPREVAEVQAMSAHDPSTHDFADSEPSPALPKARWRRPVGIAALLITALVSAALVAFVWKGGGESRAQSGGDGAAPGTVPAPEVPGAPETAAPEAAEIGETAGDATAMVEAPGEASHPRDPARARGAARMVRRRRPRRGGEPGSPGRATASRMEEPVDHGAMVGTTDLPSGSDADRARAERETRAGTDALLRGQLAVAVSRLRAATRADPRHAPAWRGLGLARERLGHDARAVRAYRRYLRLAPSAPDAGNIRDRVAALSDRAAP